MYCNVTVSRTAKVIIDRLQEVLQQKSIGTEFSDLDFCLELISVHLAGHISALVKFGVEYCGIFITSRSLYS